MSRRHFSIKRNLSRVFYVFSCDSGQGGGRTWQGTWIYCSNCLSESLKILAFEAKQAVLIILLTKFRIRRYKSRQSRAANGLKETLETLREKLSVMYFATSFSYHEAFLTFSFKVRESLKLYNVVAFFHSLAFFHPFISTCWKLQW